MEFSMSKGSNPKPIPNRKQFEENWDKIFKKKGKTFLKKETGGLTFWTHYCIVEKTEIGVESGAPCNWCGLHEDQVND